MQHMDGYLLLMIQRTTDYTDEFSPRCEIGSSTKQRMKEGSYQWSFWD